MKCSAISACWKCIVFLTVFFVETSWATPAIGQTSCKLEYLNVTPSPLFMGFDRLVTDTCEEQKLLTLAVTGNAPVYIDSITVEPDIRSVNAFEVENINVYADLQPSERGRWQIDFHVKKVGKYTATIVTVYAYADTALGRYRQCVVDTDGADMYRKKKLAEEIESKGPVFKIIDDRIVAAKASHGETLAGLQGRKMEAEARVAALIAEKKLALEEMAKGLYCSTCHKSKTQLENSGINFEQHIREGAASGRKALPASQEEIDAKAKEYDEKIDEANKTVARLADQITESYVGLQRVLNNLEAQRQQLIAVFNRRVTQLKQQVDIARTRYDSAMRSFEDAKNTRRTVTITVEGACRAK